MLQKNGSVKSLQLLLGYRANIDSLDYRNRTPLQLAGEWTRDKTEKALIDEGASPCLPDSSGNSALSVLIERLPQVALEVLDKLHTTDIITRKEFNFINFLKLSRISAKTKKARTPLEAAVLTRKFNIVSYPVMQRLINQKWSNFGRVTTIIDLCFFIILPCFLSNLHQLVRMKVGFHLKL
ncbi:POTE ankyrin domain family member A-like [Xenia sp. Carnegie-2017]|uniref:POTE ankyrin domain family member A-like n=1 Tax=Xenia sp. Carnegie-2017 TaxID=2897299 RepID=UPI001F04A23D|nr:POTE ankyrin domain family member A-like [Xenia sp. Carnegie-2017]